MAQRPFQRDLVCEGLRNRSLRYKIKYALRNAFGVQRIILQNFINKFNLR